MTTVSFAALCPLVVRSGAGRRGLLTEDLFMVSSTCAAVFARRSTNKQEDSIEQQLGQVLQHCEKKGYAVVGEPYVDKGIAGDVFDKRPSLQKMLADARGGLFSVIVTDEWSRLSRQEPIEFISTVVKPLKDAGGHSRLRRRGATALG
jgi:Resolvase, N terminal domain